MPVIVGDAVRTDLAPITPAPRRLSLKDQFPAEDTLYERRGPPLGDGTYGVVWEGRALAYIQPVAIKVLKVQDDETELNPLCLCEAEYLKRLKGHENIACLLNVCYAVGGNYGQPSVSLVMELYPTDLYTQLRRLGPYTQYGAGKLMLQLFKGLAHIHQNGIIHRDLKPENILLTRDYILKISDFGMSTQNDPEQQHTPGMVTLNYRPPEILLGECRYSFEVDMWSLDAYGLNFLQVQHYLMALRSTATNNHTNV